MSNPDVPGPYWQDPQASSGRRGAGYGGAAYGGGPAAGSGRSSSGSSGGDFGFGSAGRNGDRRAPDDSYRGQPRGGRGAGPSAGYPGSDEMRDRQRGGAPAARSGRPGPAGDRGRGEPGYRSGRSGGPGTSSGRPPQGPSPRGRGYRPEQGSPQVAQDLRDRLGVNGSRGGPQASSRRGAQGRGRGNGRGTGQWDGYGPRDEYGGRTAVGYADDGYGRTMQRGRPGSADWADDPRQPGHGRRSGKGGRGGPGGGPGGPGGPGGRGGRRTFGQWFRSGDWWRRWTWKKALGVFATLVVGSVAVVAGLFFVALSMTKIPTNTRVDASQVPSTVYFSNGHALGTFNNGGPNRQILAEADIPDVMKKAIIAAEDHNFYHEGGISVTGIIRAAYADLKGGGAVQGGSTLTEQLVKNYYDGFLTNNSQQAGSKFKEILISIKLAHSKSKAWILTQYLNTVYFGHQAYGIGAAAQTYFSEPVSKLTIAQAAMLAAMVNQPGYFQPDQSEGKAPYDALVWRWQHVVLKGLVEDGDLTADQAAKMTFPKVHYHVDNSQDGYRGYLMEMVKQELTKTYGMTQTQLATSGLKIQTTFSQRLMTSIYKAVHAGKLEMRADGQALPLYAHVGAVLERPDNGAIMAVYGGPGYGVKNCEKVHCFVNMAENPKQVGSSFKPYVLSTAVSQGMNVQNSILNGFSPLWIPEGQSVQDRAVLSSRTKPDPATATQPYLPFNAPGENSGPLTVAKAAAISSDPGFEDLAHHAGVQNVINMAKSFGVGQDPFNYLGMDDWKAMNAQFGQSSHRDTAGSVAISLGESDLTAVEQTSLFATLINGGVYHSPHVIREILQASGGKMPLRIQHHRVLSAAAAADVDYALSFDNVPGGTAYPDAAWPGRQVIGKTGTTETAQDAWFIGAIPQYSMGVTLFTDQQNSIKVGPGAQTLDILPTLPGNSDGGFGGAWPAKIWNLFMQDTFSDLAPAALPTPDYDGFAKWNLVGKMPSKKKKKGVHTNPSPPPSPSPGPTCHGNFRKCGPGSSSPPVPPTSPPPTSSSPPPTCAPFNPSCTTSPSPPTGNNIDEMAMYAAPRPARAPSGPSLVQAFGWFLRGLF